MKVVSTANAPAATAAQTALLSFRYDIRTPPSLFYEVAIPSPIVFTEVLVNAQKIHFKLERR